MSTLPVFYSPKYLYTAVTSDTTTKAAAVAESLVAQSIPNAVVREPSRAITESEIALVHSPEYAKAIATGSKRALADSNGLCDWTPDFASSRLWATGGVRDAVLEALRTRSNAGSMSSGLHHAKRGHDEGFCYINGLALAALRAINFHKVKKVGVLDLDAHCGGGTFSMVGDNENVFIADVSCNGYDSWKPTSERHFLEIVGDASDYLNAVKRSLTHLAGIDAMIYNAGMDPFEDCDTGGLQGITRDVLAEREQLVAQWCEDTQTPAMFVLAGGYGGTNLDLEGVARLHLPTIREFARVVIEPKKSN